MSSHSPHHCFAGHLFIYLFNLLINNVPFYIIFIVISLWLFFFAPVISSSGVNGLRDGGIVSDDVCTQTLTSVVSSTARTVITVNSTARTRWEATRVPVKSASPFC